jgi:NAD(P)-dependent dehydrogenase (short-subunit alcohol dehydrogenase family)
VQGMSIPLPLPLPQNNWMSKLVCISGCSRGLGRAMALEFASRGWKVAGGARSTDDLETLRNKLQSDHFIDFLDVTDQAGVDSFASRTEEILGVPDLLVNNAGLINRNAPLAEITPEEFSSVLSVNLGGIHNMIRSFVPKMIEKGQGIIANFSSYWGQSTAPEVAPYCATKWGVEGLTRSLAQELPSGLAAVAFNPGVINTDMLQSTFGAEAKDYPNPQDWSVDAVTRLENLDAQDNGQSCNP